MDVETNIVVYGVRELWSGTVISAAFQRFVSSTRWSQRGDDIWR